MNNQKDTAKTPIAETAKPVEAIKDKDMADKKTAAGAQDGKTMTK